MNRVSVLIVIVSLIVCVLGCEQPRAKIKPKSVDVAQAKQTNKPVQVDALTAQPSTPITSTQNPQTPETSGDPSDSDPKPVDQEALEKHSIDDLPEVIRSGELDTAAILIERFLEKEPHNPKLHASRQLLASTYNRMRNQDVARGLNDKLLEYFFAHADGNRDNVEMFPATVLFVNSMYSQMGKNDERKKIVDDAYQILLKNHEKFIDSKRVTLGINQLVGIKIRDLVNAGKKEEAIKFANSEIARTQKYWEKNSDNDWTLYGYTCALRSAIINLPFDVENNKTRMSKFRDLVTNAVDVNAASPLFAEDYFFAVQRQLSIALKDDPELAKQIYDDGLARLNKIKAAQTDDKRIVKNIELFQRAEARITRSLKLKSLVGTPAVELSATHWINGDKKSLDELKGKTTLLYFCAVWSRPCINVLPRIEGLAKKHEASGLQVIGVTRPYGYYWDDAANRPLKAKTAVPVETEVAMVQKFVSENKFPFPVAMTSMETYDKFGAGGVPHFVLIDKNGAVRRVDVGMDPKMLDAMDSMIKKVLAE